jgi:Carboxypeptidase regulatory-like domain/TonB-dependent Receptor Plug Domain
VGVRRRLLSVLAWPLLFSAAALAQTTGDIEGTVTDTTGVLLPGVTIEATSPRLQGVRVEASGRDGKYRVLAVPPGKYRIHASLPGFETVDETVTVSLDAKSTLDLKLKLIVRETVTVTGEIPLVDVTSTVSGTNYTSKVISKLPVARNYADIVRSDPAVDTDRGETQGRGLALTVYGATSVENQWIIDGINTTNVILGFQGKAINNEFVDEVEVKTGGYQAEYGRALGGIVNVITKSGGNRFHGDAFGYYDSKSTRADQVVTARDSLIGMRITPAKRWDYGADVGGYVFRDRLWFFAALDRVDAPGTTSRYQDLVDDEGHVVLPSSMQFPRNQRDTLYSGKLTWNIATGSTLVATAFSDPSRIDGASRVGTGFGGGLISNADPGTWDSRREIGGTDFGLRLNQLFGSSAVLAVQASRHRDRFELFASGPAAQTRVEDWTCAGGTPDTPCDIPFQPNSVSGGLGNIFGPQQRNFSRRDQARLDFALYKGNHEIKVGADYQNGKTTAITAFTGGQGVRKYSEFGQIYYAHIFFAKSTTDLSPADSVISPRNIDASVYLQDSWKVLPGLTVNAGLRWDQEDMRDYLDETVIKTTNEWQPRLGIVWDPTGSGKMKVYASVGRFYYSLPTDLSVFAYSASVGETTFNFDLVDKTQNPAVIGHERAFVSVTGVAEPVDAGLKGIYQDELTLGVERLLAPTLSVGIKGTYRRIGRGIEDRCDLDYNQPENNYYSCAIVNLGSNGKFARGDFQACNGLDGKFYECGISGALPTPEVRRIYRGIELSARKSFAEKLWLQTSYVYSSLRGNWDGAVYESIGQTAPGISADYDYPQFWARNNSGRLSLDRPHSFRLDASYTTPFGLFVGLQTFVKSGTPLNRLGYFNGGYGAVLQLVPRGYAGRLPTLWEANLTLGYPIVLGPATVTLQAYAFNLFNNQIATQEDQQYTVNRPPGYPATLYDPNVPADRVSPNYGHVLARQDPRLIRGAIKVSF